MRGFSQRSDQKQTTSRPISLLHLVLDSSVPDTVIPPSPSKPLGKKRSGNGSGAESPGARRVTA
eukprot:5796528-Amphidinium_carterae.1